MKNLILKETILINDKFFSALISDIEQAKSTITLETYMFEDDIIGKKVSTALCLAANRGVKIRILLDGFGSKSLNDKLSNRLIQSGIQLRIYRPLPWIVKHWRISSNYGVVIEKLLHLILYVNKRNHRKVCLIDNRIGYVGSANISEGPDRKMKHVKWEDITIRFVGSTQPLQYAFDLAWGDKKPNKLKLSNNTFLKKYSSVFRLNYSWKLKRAFYKDLLYKLKNSKQRIWITTAYFVPNNKILKRLTNAAKSGIEVIMMLTKKSDVTGYSLLTKNFYRYLIESNVIVREYVNDVVFHGKVIIIDDWMCVGTSNINHRSLHHDLEMDMCVQLAPTKKTIEKVIKKYHKQSKKITIESLGRQSIFKKILGRSLLLFKYWF